MAEEFVELGLSKPDASRERALAVATWLVDRLLVLITDAVVESESLNSAGFRRSVDRYRERLGSASESGGLDEEAKTCVETCEQQVIRARRYLVEREDELREVIAVLADGLEELTGESNAFNARLLGESDSLNRLGDIGDIRELKRQIAEHVGSLRRAVQEKQKQDEASQAKLSRQVKRLQLSLNEAQTEAATDGLTGVANRRSFDRALPRWVSQATESGKPFALAMLDVDNMKQINDTYGHQIGDRVLLAVGQRLAQGLRRTDLAVRYGGDEFALLFGEMTLVQAEKRMSELVKDVAAARYDYEDAGVVREVRFTLSCGVVEYASSESVEDVLRRADEALYEAKRAGRNRVVARRRGLFAGLLERKAR